MNVIIEALESMEAAALGNARLEALKKSDSPELRTALILTLSPQVTFGVKKLPVPSPESIAFGDDTVWQRNLFRLLDDLKTRKLSGTGAQTAIGVFLGACSGVQRKWSERILKQDLRLNVGAKDVNSTLGEGTIFQFTVPLAEDYAKVDPKHFGGRWAVEPKLDGARTVAWMPANRGRVVLYSRSGKEFINFESIRLKLQEINDNRNPTQDLVFDGEVVSYVNEKVDFQALQHTLFRKDGVESGKLKYLVFDGTDRTDWESPKKSYQDRYNFVSEFIKNVTMSISGVVTKIGVVSMFITTDPDKARMERYSKDFVEKGYEGAMMRRIDEPVLLKRSRSLMKVKSFLDAEALVVGLVEGTGKYDGHLGALVCELPPNKDFGVVRFEIGSGFTDEQRKVFWKGRETLPKTLNFKYQELTDAGIPRFPIFKGFRSETDL